MEEVEKGAIWNIIRNGVEDELERIRKGMQIRIDQEIQSDWNKLKSEFLYRLQIPKG